MWEFWVILKTFFGGENLSEDLFRLAKMRDCFDYQLVRQARPCFLPGFLPALLSACLQSQKAGDLRFQ
jgi:hypothetical protein